jgi:hypothetical protein
MKLIIPSENRFLLILISITLILVSCEKPNTVESSVVINELLAVNKTVAADQDGEFDDWIEMYNNGSVDLDLAGYFLSDSRSTLTKWKFPPGSIINAGSYLIIWADEDTTQNGLHANFKLSSEGENVYFVTPDKLIIDKVSYPEQPVQLSYSRIPDGTGDFIWNTPSFNASNKILR